MTYTPGTSDPPVVLREPQSVGVALRLAFQDRRICASPSLESLARVRAGSLRRRQVRSSVGERHTAGRAAGPAVGSPADRHIAAGRVVDLLEVGRPKQSQVSLSSSE